MLGTASAPPGPPKHPKILGCLYTSPMCVSPLPRPPVPETWWNTASNKAYEKKLMDLTEKMQDMERKHLAQIKEV